jgi:hypothetical protein
MKTILAENSIHTIKQRYKLSRSSHDAIRCLTHVFARGPDSDELRLTLGEMDRQFKRMLSVLEE